MNNKLDCEDNNCNLGGFPNIIFMNKEKKKIREFRKVSDNIDLKGFNILNIKNILKTK